MANRIYAVTFHVTEGNLPTVLSTLNGSATLVGVEVIQKEASSSRSSTASSAPTVIKASRFVGGLRDKGIRGEDLAMEMLNSSDRAFTMTELQSGFARRGFAGNTANSVMSKLVSAGKARALGGGSYCRVGLTVHIGATASGGGMRA